MIHCEKIDLYLDNIDSSDLGNKYKEMIIQGQYISGFFCKPSINSAQRRIPEEIGISCKFDYLFKFEYHVPYKDIGSENEICGTLIGVIENSTQFNLVKDEISETKWITADELIEGLQKKPEIYCPWMIIALYLLPKSEESMLSKYKSVISQWIKPEIEKPLEDSIKYHLQDNKWRLVN